MTLSGWHLLAWLAGSILVAVAVTLTILLLTYRARVGGLAEQARTARYVFAYDDALQWLGVGYRERGRLTGEIRSNISAAAADAPVLDVLERMGPAKELARAVAARRRGPTWVVGAVAALVVIVAQILVTILMQLSFISAVKSIAAPYQTVTANVPLWQTFEATMGDAGRVAMFSTTSHAGGLILPALTFIIWSRPWRLITHRAARRASGDSVSV